MEGSVFMGPVSYTHLDVYKRQVEVVSIRPNVKTRAIKRAFFYVLRGKILPVVMIGDIALASRGSSM